jgi:hypothetical protein
MSPFLPSPPIVTFKSHNNVALPSAELLNTHWVLANILHTSGVGKEVERLMRDWDELQCLANDGSTNFGDIIFARLPHHGS